MKSFISMQTNIINEIIMKDINYKSTSLSLVEKTLKYLSNDYLDCIDLINKYIKDADLKNKLHELRKEANYNKHDYSEIEFSDVQVMRTISILDEYFSYINKNFSNKIEVVNFKRLYTQKKNDWVQEHSIEVEKIVTIEKEIPVIQKEYITIEKPVIKEVDRKGNNISFNNNYMELQLLNETNNKGLFINSLELKMFDITLDLLLKKIKHNIPLTKEENECCLLFIDDFFPLIRDYLFEYKLSNIFNDDVIISFLEFDRDSNKFELLQKYIADETNISLYNVRMYQLIKDYIMFDSEKHLRYICQNKNHLSLPGNVFKLRELFASIFNNEELIKLIGEFEDKSWLESVTFDTIKRDYKIEVNNQIIDLLKKYRWGQELICIEYVVNNCSLITFDVFVECYKKNINQRINILILTSKRSNAVSIVEKLDNINISLIEEFNNICNKYDGKNTLEILKAYKYYVDYNVFNYNIINESIIEYYLITDQIKNETLLRIIFMKNIEILNIDIINILMDKLNVVFTYKELETKFDVKISSDKEVKFVKKILKKCGDIPVDLLNSCFKYNFLLSCELFYEYILDNMDILVSKDLSHSYIIDYKDIIKILSELIPKLNRKQLEEALYLAIDLIIHAKYKNDSQLVEFIKLINEKNVYIADIIPIYKEFFKKESLIVYIYNLNAFFEKNEFLVNNFNITNTIKIYSRSFIIKHLNDENAKVYIANKNCTDSELLCEILDTNNIKIIKKAYELGINFGIKCEKVFIDRKLSPLDYYKISIDEQKKDIINYLLMIELKYILKVNPMQLSYKINGKKDYLDVLLENEKSNKEALEFIKNNFDLKVIYSKLFEYKSSNINQLKKKLFIKEKYLEDVRTHDDLFQFRSVDVARLKIDSNVLINMYKYYLEKNDLKKVNFIKKIKNKDFENYLKQCCVNDELLNDGKEVKDITNIVNEIAVNSVKKKRRKRKTKVSNQKETNTIVNITEEKNNLTIADIKLNSDIKESEVNNDTITINGEEKNKRINKVFSDSLKNKIKNEFFSGFLFNLFCINIWCFIAIVLLLGFFPNYTISVFEINVDFIKYGWLILILVNIILTIIVTLINIITEEENDYSLLSIYNLCQFFGTLLTFFLLWYISFINFNNGIEIVNKVKTSNCVILTIKNNNGSASISNDGILYGGKTLYMGNISNLTPKQQLTYKLPNIKYDNIKNVKEVCGINFELVNPIVYESVLTGQVNRVKETFYIDKGVEYTLVFRTIADEELQIGNYTFNYEKND